jgi:hypothetical protein
MVNTIQSEKDVLRCGKKQEFFFGRLALAGLGEKKLLAAICRSPGPAHDIRKAKKVKKTEKGNKKARLAFQGLDSA